MITAGRTAAIAMLALASGFVGGAWFVGSGAAFGVIREPSLPADDAKPARPPVARPAPHVKAVAVPPLPSFRFSSGGLGPRAERVDLLPSPGCNWAIEPRPFRMPARWHSTDPERALGGYAAIDASSGGLRYLFIQCTRSGATQDLRPVFFDAEGNRHVARSPSSGRTYDSGGAFQMNEYFLDPLGQLAPAQVAYFGIERVVPDAAKRLVVAAQEEAKTKGMAILPPPELGQPYPVDLPTVSGDRVRSADLHGKAVLVAVWGPGSSGLGLMTARKVRAASSKDELEIVNVSFDGSAQDARETLAREKASGPVVAVPNDPASRRIWREGSGIVHLPAFFLIDREGTLRFTCGLFELSDRVDTLLGRPSKTPVLRPTYFRRPGAAPSAPAARPPDRPPGSLPDPSSPQPPGL